MQNHYQEKLFEICRYLRKVRIDKRRRDYPVTPISKTLNTPNIVEHQSIPRRKPKCKPQQKPSKQQEQLTPGHHLILDETLPITGPTRVHVIILLPEDFDISETEWLQAAAANPAFYFLKDTEEDIYTLSDGRPFYDEG